MNTREKVVTLILLLNINSLSGKSEQVERVNTLSQVAT